MTEGQAEQLNLATIVYEQQRIMFESKTYSVPQRIVSFSHPLGRPIVRGKAHANTEFDAKLHIGLVNGYARIERLDWRQRASLEPARLLTVWAVFPRV